MTVSQILNNSQDNTQSRKADHIRICLEEEIECKQQTSGLEKYRFDHCCMPELDFQDIDLGTEFLGKSLGAPLLISSMTGGTDLAKTINYRLAEAAQKYNLAMGVGSQRIAIEKPEVADTFAVRSIAPDILLFANLGAVQLNYTYGIEQCLRAIEILAADALILHINPLQECIQTKGDTNFKNLLDKIHDLCSKLTVPVIAKEVGNGISAVMAKKLVEAGVKAIDVAGAGGTSWAKVESERAQTHLQRELGRTFADWGIPTAECIVGVRQSLPQIPLIASGGLRDGLDAAKSIALGADLAGLALPFLKAAADSPQVLDELVRLLLAELATVLFCTGNINLKTFKKSACLKVLN